MKVQGKQEGVDGQVAEGETAGTVNTASSSVAVSLFEGPCNACAGAHERLRCCQS